MHSSAVTGDRSAATVDDRFLELICADAELLAAEFDDIVAAAWPGPADTARRRGAAAASFGSGASGHPSRGPRDPRAAVGTDPRGRQRAPPAADIHMRDGQEGG
jgi:hypothetical protein